MEMMKLNLVNDKTAEEEVFSADGTAPDEDVNNGTKLLKELVYPWSGKGDIVVAAESYFACVQSSKSLEKMGLGFICVVKKSSRQYPIIRLQRK